MKPGAPLPWIRVAPGSPYFETEDGESWTPIGGNDAITWPDLAGLWRGRDPAAVERRLTALRDHGVTVLRLMLEYNHHDWRWFERPAGRFVPNMVRLWDDLFALCERLGLRIMLTPFDTFWFWLNFRRHPYAKLNGGPLDSPGRMLLDADMRAAIKRRLSFAVERWSGTGALFAWDLWNEIHPAHAENTADVFPEFIADLSSHVRELERRLYGRTHPQTVSLFGPELSWKPHLPLREPIFRHPALDFASLHIYAHGSIDDPKDTVRAAAAIGRIVRESLAEITDGRPFLDSEHGPIHVFKDRRTTLPEAFDDEYFRHMQWAHLASGGAGGGMRWPNRHPHLLTDGMRRAQGAMARFLPLIDWSSFRRRNLTAEIATPARNLAVFGCGDDRQAVVYLLRKGTIGTDGRLRRDAPVTSAELRVPGLRPGACRVTAWNTEEGRATSTLDAIADPGGVTFRSPDFVTDLALAVRALEPDGREPI